MQKSQSFTIAIIFISIPILNIFVGARWGFYTNYGLSRKALEIPTADRIAESIFEMQDEEKGFQIDADQEALSTNQIASFRNSVNQSRSSKHQSENLPELKLDSTALTIENQAK